MTRIDLAPAIRGDARIAPKLITPNSSDYGFRISFCTRQFSSSAA